MRRKRDEDTVTEESSTGESSSDGAAEQQEGRGTDQSIKKRIGRPSDGQAVFAQWLVAQGPILTHMKSGCRRAHAM